MFKYKTFSNFHDEVLRADKKPAKTWIKIILYPFYLLTLSILTAMFLGFITSISEKKSKYPSDRYRKVIKEGILWDDVEYHER